MNDDLTDDELMHKFSNCSFDAYKELYNRKKNVLFNHIVYSNNFPEDVAQDIVQNTLIKVYESKFIYNHKQKFNAWLFKIVKNFVLNEVKRNTRTSEFERIDAIDKEDSYIIDSDRIKETETRINIVKEEISKLKEIYKEVIYLKYIQNMTMEEITEVTGENLNTIKSRLKRGLEILNNKLKNIDFD